MFVERFNKLLGRAERILLSGGIPFSAVVAVSSSGCTTIENSLPRIEPISGYRCSIIKLIRLRILHALILITELFAFFFELCVVLVTDLQSKWKSAQYSAVLCCLPYWLWSHKKEAFQDWTRLCPSVEIKLSIL